MNKIAKSIPTAAMTLLLLAGAPQWRLYAADAADADVAAVPAAGAGTGANAAIPQPPDSLQRLMTVFQELQDNRNANHARCDRLLRGEALLKRGENPEAVLEAALRLQFASEKFLSRLDLERTGNIEFKGGADRYAAENGTGIMPQEQRYLDGYADSLREFGKAQDAESRAIKSMLSRVQELIRKLPPPAAYENALGMKMRLVAVRKFAPFYITDGPVSRAQWNRMAKRSDSLSAAEPDDDGPRVEIAFQEAQKFASAVSRYLFFAYSLPTSAQCAALERSGKMPPMPVACWVGTPWLADKYAVNPDEKEAMGRFGMKMAALWDPSSRLFRNHHDDDEEDGQLPAICGELPQAAYRDLGICLAAPVQAGVAARYDAVSRKIAENPEADDGDDDSGKGEAENE